MRSIAFNMIILTFCLSTMTFAMDVVLLSPLGISPTTIEGDPIDTEALVSNNKAQFGSLTSDAINPQYEGNVIDRITTFSTGGFDAVWTMITLLTGSYYLHWAVAVGAPPIWIFIFQGVFPIAIIITVIKYIRGIE